MLVKKSRIPVIRRLGLFPSTYAFDQLHHISATSAFLLLLLLLVIKAKFHGKFTEISLDYISISLYFASVLSIVRRSAISFQ